MGILTPELLEFEIALNIAAIVTLIACLPEKVKVLASNTLWFCGRAGFWLNQAVVAVEHSGVIRPDLIAGYNCSVLATFNLVFVPEAIEVVGHTAGPC